MKEQEVKKRIERIKKRMDKEMERMCREVFDDSSGILSIDYHAKGDIKIKKMKQEKIELFKVEQNGEKIKMKFDLDFIKKNPEICIQFYNKVSQKYVHATGKPIKLTFFNKEGI